MFAYQSMECQKVHNMKVTSEFIKFDDEDQDNKDEAVGAFPFGVRNGQPDNLLFMCYYEYYVPDRNDEFSHNIDGNEQPDSATVTSLDDSDVVGSLALMNEFLNSTSFQQEEGGEENCKTERTAAIIKTIVVKSNERSVPKILGLISAGVLLGMAVFMVVKRTISSRGKQRNGKYFLIEQKEREFPRKQNKDKKLSIKKGFFTGNTSRSNLATITEEVREVATEATECDNYDNDDDDTLSDDYPHRMDNFPNPSGFVFDDDELVEDQLLPDSALKTGLEMLFLKQQRHYWSQKLAHKQRQEPIR
jgi:hypothetical protein